MEWGGYTEIRDWASSNTGTAFFPTFLSSAFHAWGNSFASLESETNVNLTKNVIMLWFSQRTFSSVKSCLNVHSSSILKNRDKFTDQCLTSHLDTSLEEVINILINKTETFLYCFCQCHTSASVTKVNYQKLFRPFGKV